jgi:hypothetical protein
LLENKIFDNYRRNDLEKPAPVKLTLGIDDKEADGEEETQQLIQEIQQNVAVQLIKLYKNNKLRRVKVVE